MRILYLSEDYSTSKVHHQLISQLCESGHDVKVFTVVRLSEKESDISKTYFNTKYKVCFSELSKRIEPFYKLIFGYKKHKKYSELVKGVNVSDIDIVHAATLFSEGVIAYELFRRHAIPYTVAVRGTDVELYLSKMPHLWPLGRKILLNASKIIFITPVLLENFKIKRPIKKIWLQIEDKCVIIPNGIEDYWIDNRREKQRNINPNQVLFIGRFDKNKNVARLIDAVILLKRKFPNINLNLVGGGDSCHSEILQYCKTYPDTVRYLGKIYDKDKLLEVMRSNHIFAMVSHSETFGLVYIEALSQGLPILYTKGQGIDGSVPAIVGESADSYDVEDISHKLDQLISNNSFYEPSKCNISDYSWNNIATEYLKIFETII